MGSELSTRAMQTFENTRQAVLGQRVFGEAYQVGDTTIIPVSHVRGGGGAGSGDGETGQTEGKNAGRNAGTGAGFGINALPVGVYAVRDGEVEWKPAFDTLRVAIGGQIVAVVALLTIRKIFGKRH